MEALFANETPKVKCSHCGGVIGSTWESEWPMNGHIQMGLDCCSLDTLWGDNWNKKGYSFDHPAMTEKNGYQNIEFKWNYKGKYRLCWHCQRILMRIIGSFFKTDLCYIKEEKKDAPQKSAEAVVNSI